MKRTTLLFLSTLLACAALAGQEGRVPTFEQVIGVLADGTSPAWSQYCAAFAEE